MPERGPQVGSAHVKIYPEYERANLNRTLGQISADIRRQAGQANSAWTQSTKAALADVGKAIAASQAQQSKARFAALAEDRKANDQLAKQRQQALANEAKDIQRRISELSKWYDSQKKMAADAARQKAIITAELNDGVARAQIAALKREANFTAHARVEVDKNGFQNLNRELGAIRTSLRALDRAIPSPFAALGVAVLAATPLLIPLISSLGAAAAAAAAGIPAMAGLGVAAAGMTAAFAPVKFALNEYSSIQDKVARGTLTAAEGQQKWNELLARMPASTRPMIAQLIEMNKAFEGMGETFRRAAFPGFVQFLRDSTTLFPLFNQHVGAVGTSMGALAVEAGKVVKSPLFQSQMAVMLEGSRTAFDRLLQAVLPAVSAIMSIGEAATPVLIDLATWVSNVVQRFAGWIEIQRVSGDLARFFTIVSEEAQKWLNIILNFGQGILTVFAAALPTGQKLSTTILEISIAFERWTRANTDKIAAFFETLRTLPWVEILKGIAGIVIMVVALQALNKSVAVITALSTFLGLLAGVGGPVAATLAAIAGAIVLIAGAFTLLYLYSDRARAAVNDFLKGFKDGFLDVWHNVLSPIFNQIKNSWNQAVDSITRTLEKFGLTWEDIGRIVGIVVGGIVAVLLGPLVVAATAGALAWRGIEIAIGAVRTAWDALWPHLQPVIDGVLIPAFNRAKVVVGDLRQAFTDVVAWAKPKLQELGAEARRFWEEDVKPTWDTLKREGQDIWTKLRDAWYNDLKPALEDFKVMWREDLKPTLDEWRVILERDVLPFMRELAKILGAIAVIEGFTSLQKLTLILKGIGVAAQGANVGLTAVLTTSRFLSEQTRGSLDVLGGVAETVLGTITDQWNRIAGAARTAWQAIRDIDWSQLGRDIVDGLFAPLDIARRIEQWANDNILQPIKRFLGIDSPSKLFIQIGKDIVNGLVEGLKSAPNAILEAIKSLIPNDIGSLFGGVKDTIGGLFGGNQKGPSISAPDFSGVESAYRGFANRVKGILQEIPDRMGNIVGWFKNNLPGLVRDALGGVAGPFTDLKTLATGRFTEIQTKATEVKDWFNTTAGPQLRTVLVTVMGGAFTALWTTARDRFQNIQDRANQLKTFFQTTIVSGFNSIRTQLVSTFTDTWNRFRDRWNDIHNKAVDIKNKLANTWNAVRSALTSAFNDLAQIAAGAINRFINVINDVIGKINAILPKDLKIKSIGGVSSGVTPQPARGGTNRAGRNVGGSRSSLASGGPVWGSGGPRTDSVMGERYGIQNVNLSRDEHIISHKEVKGFGGHYALAQMRRMAAAGMWRPPIVADGSFLRGYRDGGRIGLVDAGPTGLGAYANRDTKATNRGTTKGPGGGGDQGVWRVLGQLGRILGSGPVTSAYRPGDRVGGGGYSWHASGQAADLGGYNQDGAAAAFHSKYGGALLELIHSTGKGNYGIKNGASHDMGSQLWAEHKDHIHVASTMASAQAMLAHAKSNKNAVFSAPGAGDGGFGNPLLAAAFALFQKLSPGIDKLIPKGDNILDNPIRMVMEKMKEHVSMQLSAGAAGSAVNGLGGALGSVVREAMKIAGVPDSWYNGIMTIIQRESGGNPNAINNWDSNAKNGDPSRGLMQTIGATFKRFKLPGLSNNIFDPLSNIVAGIRYIKSRYGDISRVQQANASAPPRGYDNGGPLPPGGTAYNASNGVEMVLNRGQGLALQRRLDADGRPLVVHQKIYLDGKIIDERIERYDENESRQYEMGVRP